MMPTDFDPWAFERSSPRRRPPSTRALPVGVAVLCAAPFIVRVWSHGDRARLAGALLASAALVWAEGVSRPTRSIVRSFVVAGVVIAMAAGTVPLIGRAPALLLVAGLAVATPCVVAVGGRGPAGIVPLGPLALAGLLWLRHGSVVVHLVAVGVSVASVAASRRRPGLLGGVDRRLTTAARVAGDVVGTVVFLLVSLPLLYLPATVWGWVRRWGDRRLDRTGTTWRTRHIDPLDERRDATRPFAPVRRRRRVAANLVGAAVVVALLGAVTVARGPSRPDDERDGLTAATLRDRVELRDTPAFEGVEWADRISAEQDRFTRSSADPDLVGRHGVRRFHGSFVTVDDGVRRSARPGCKCPTVRVWWLGGSGAWGWNQRDEHTIASSLARVAARDGLDLELVNLAVPGHTAHQQYELLARVLADTGPAREPDLVVFYDGFNDVAASIVDAAEGVLDVGRPAILDNRRFLAYQADPPDLAAAGGADEVGRLAADRYLATMSQVRVLVEPTGADVVSVLQADAFPSPAQLRFVRELTQAPAAQVARSDFARALDAAEARLAPHVVNMRRSLDVEQPVFTDPVHTNERGALLVARELYRRLRSDLHGLAR